MVPEPLEGRSEVTSCSRIGGEAGAVLLLGDHAVEGGLEAGPDRRYGVLLVQEREGGLSLAFFGGAR
jgi:hypothetical protein